MERRHFEHKKVYLDEKYAIFLIGTDIEIANEVLYGQLFVNFLFIRN